MISIAVLEDLDFEREQVLSCLHRYEKEKNVAFEIHCFSDGEEFVLTLLFLREAE